jgi:uncharacterized protein (TIGR00725 family)
MSEQNETNKYICYNGPMGNTDQHGHTKMKLGVSGAAETGKCGLDALDKAKELGREIVRQGGIIVTGATTGFPLWSAMGAKEMGGISIGLSPAVNAKDHVEGYRLPLDYMDMIIYTGFGFPGRDLLFTRSCDALFVGCGRIGTIHEFTIAFEEGRPIGVLEGDWTMDEQIRDMLDKSGRSAEKVIFDSDPKSLVSKVVAMVEKDNAGLNKL